MKNKLLLIISLFSNFYFGTSKSVLIFGPQGYEETINSFNKNFERAQAELKENNKVEANKLLNNAENDLKYIGENAMNDIENNTPLRAFLAAKKFYPANKIDETNSNAKLILRNLIAAKEKQIKDLYPAKRLFIALKLPKKIESLFEVYQNYIKGKFEGFKPESIHITLVFLGQKEVSQIKKIKESIEKVLSEYNNRIDPIKISSTDFFGKNKNIIVFKTESKQLVELVKKLTRQLAKNNVITMEESQTISNDFLPHVTLGRFDKKKADKELIKRIKNFSPDTKEIKPEAIVIYETQENNYLPLEVFKLL